MTMASSAAVIFPWDDPRFDPPPLPMPTFTCSAHGADQIIPLFSQRRGWYGKCGVGDCEQFDNRWPRLVLVSNSVTQQSELVAA